MVLPYVYLLIHKDTRQFYFGYRERNIVSSSFDLGITYFTSSRYIKNLGFENFEIQILDEAYAKDKMFVVYMILFGCACNFMRIAEKLVKQLYKKMKKTATTDYKIPHQELMLFRNPRMMRR